MSLKVALYCSGCRETFTGSIGLVGSLCGDGRIVRAEDQEDDEDPTAGFTFCLEKGSGWE